VITISAFADEISAEPGEQIAVLKSCGVKHIEFRSIHKTNVLNLNDEQIARFKKLLDDEGFKLSAIGSPIGKIKVDDPFEPHLEKFQRAIQLCKVFGTPNIRIFSYYPPEKFDGNWAPYREEVLRRMQAKADIAAKAGVVLFHENEHRIYGDAPARVKDIFDHVKSPALKAAHDPANFVYGGFDPWAGWLANKPYLAHFHVKDWKKGEEHGCLPGLGDGLMEKVLTDAIASGYSGFATMEPHLLGGGPTGGVTGPLLFPNAVGALRAILDKIGVKYQ
jgi:sugar phosphate isomerase/epimerase